MSEKISFSIVIPTFNGATKIPSLLQALAKQSYKNVEILIIIDGSTDDTENVAVQILSKSKFPYSIFKKVNSGRGSTRNFGAKEAKNDFLLFFDDDMCPEPDCLASFSYFHSRFESSIAVGTQLEDLNVMKTDFQKYKAFLSRKWEGENHGEIKKYTPENLHLTAANFSISKVLFEQLGGFDERLSDVEDFEFATRAVAQNIPIYYLPHAKAWHNDLITCKSYVTRQRQYNKAYEDLLAIRPELVGKFQQTMPNTPSLAKNALYWPFSFPFWKDWIDNENPVIKLLPQKIRYKLYDLVVWAQGKLFLD